jgi:hypothetical protein
MTHKTGFYNVKKTLLSTVANCFFQRKRYIIHYERPSLPKVEIRDGVFGRPVLHYTDSVLRRPYQRATSVGRLRRVYGQRFSGAEDGGPYYPAFRRWGAEGRICFGRLRHRSVHV